MTAQALQAHFKPEPLPPDEILYIGVDIGKEKQHCGFCSETLLKQHKMSWKACPYLCIDRSREGFSTLLTVVEQYVPLSRCIVLFEHTGHFSVALEEFLLDMGILSFRHHVKQRPNRLVKSDKRDALALASTIYNHHKQGIQALERHQHFIRCERTSTTVTLIRGLVSHRSELVQDMTRRKNKLTAIQDQIFPEFARIYKDVNSPSALAIRLKFPTPQSVAAASIEELCSTMIRTYPGRAKLLELQKLARLTIGTRNEARACGLIVEQKQLIREMDLADKHLWEIDRFIERAMQDSREGKILLSLPGFALTSAATLLAGMGSIANFSTPARLRAYCGWAPNQDQTGKTRNSTNLDKSGNHQLRQCIFMAVLTTIKGNTTKWAILYHRLVERKCAFDAAKGDYVGKMPVVGRIAGQMISVIYTLLKRDYETLQKLQPGETAPPPILYDPAQHRIHE